MRIPLAIALTLFCSSAIAEDLYQIKNNEFGSCLGTEIRQVLESHKRPSSEVLAEILEIKCGRLEQEANDAFGEFIKDQIGKVLTAETAFKIQARLIVSPESLRGIILKSYREAIANK